ncbi:MAG: DNA repair protein RecN [Duodenibacillus sp.]|nr:DNA repair protein RecN [Duodenibacillus sp.]
MLQLLTLKDFVIVPFLSIEADKGLTCLTGETGAGKSILIDALELVLGARSDAGLIREGAERTEVSAEFSATPRARTWLANAGLEAGDTVLLRRTVDIRGRSRAWINATPVTITQMKELGERLVDIHGQHAHQSLLKPAYQLQLVDGFGSTKAQRIKVRDAWLAWQEKLSLLTQATQDTDRLQAESERLQWINEILEELSPREGEWDKLSEEHKVLSNAADIVTHVQNALDNLRDGPESALRALGLAQNALRSAARWDEACAGFDASLGEAANILEDAARELSHRLDKLDIDDERLTRVEERLDAYWKISRKFHRTPEELHDFWMQTRERIGQIELTSDIAALEKSEQKAKEAYLKEAGVLTTLRRQAAQELSEAVTAEMQTLSMAGGRLEIALHTSEPRSGGLETCEFLVSGHAGATPRALTKVASGGELARISLAIAVITAQITPVPTLIFDEVDSGIGGAVAEVVGRLLRRLGASRQVLCVTHLPQVAACGHQQWLVKKHTEDGRTTSSLRTLSEKERTDEIARMLGGTVITDATRVAARELLDTAARAEN